MDSKRLNAERGQTSLETAIIYSFVILVVIVAAIVVWQSGVLKPIFGKKGFVGFSQIAPEDWIIGTNQAYIYLKNTGETPIIVEANDINVSFQDLECLTAPALRVNLQPSEAWTVRVLCPGLDEKYKVGDYYDADVTINYTNAATQRRHVSVGKLYGHIEVVPPGWTPPTITTTTQTTIPRCFYHECNKSGEMDDLNCGDIIYREECRYCPIEPDPVDGKRKCHYNGRCQERCTVNKECSPNDPLNLCKVCINGTCREAPPTNNTACGPCSPSDAGTFTSLWCDKPECRYCYHQWIQLSDVVGDGYDSYTCTENGSCGDSCTDVGFDTYQDCKERCTACQPDPANPGNGICTQGSCNQRCGPDAPNPDCNQGGCDWCNMTSYECQQGDCGRPCDASSQTQQCNLGCNVCFDGRCVKADIAVTLNAHNGSGGKVVSADGPIELDVRAEGAAGIERMLISNSIVKPANMTCTQIADERNREAIEYKITDPWGGDDDKTLEWLTKWWGGEIPWNDSYACGGAPTCTNKWFTTEHNESMYCYFAIAQEYKPSGGGRWSLIAADYIQVGYIQVYLIYPKPIKD